MSVFWGFREFNKKFLNGVIGLENIEGKLGLEGF